MSLETLLNFQNSRLASGQTIVLISIGCLKSKSGRENTLCLRTPSALALKAWGSMIFSSGLDVRQASATVQFLWREKRGAKKSHLISLFMACFRLKHAFEIKPFV
jgi:hypothetical protein